MTDLDHLDAIHQVLVASHGNDGPVADGYAMSGAIVIGLYVAPDGESTGTWSRNLGAMNAFTQEGVLRDRLRNLLDGMRGDD